MLYAYSESDYPFMIPHTFHGYKSIKVLNAGFYSVVALVEDIYTHTNFAAKFISKKDMINKKQTYIISKEIQIMKTLDHPNIIKLYEFFDITNDLNEEYFVLITEYCENGDLLEFIQEKDFQNEEEKKKVILGIAKSIQYLHNRGISHGDIKPENILLDYNMNPKLCDFGFADTSLICNSNEIKGTLKYLSPEILKKCKYNRLKSDIWALGITYYAISEKSFPFYDEDDDFVINQILNGYLLINPDDQLQNIVGKCTKMNVNDRITINELIQDEYFDF